ncbi:MAG: NUDIX domain-containing protein [Erythrobacter sp.]
MLHLIERLLPAGVHRALLPLAHNMRHRIRRWRGVPIAGVSVVLTNATGSVLLLRHSYGPPVWALPGGGLDRGENPADAARREVREELGVMISDMVNLGTIEETISGSPHTAYLFAAPCEVEPKPDGREIIEAHFFAENALPAPLGELTECRLSVWRERRGTVS